MKLQYLSLIISLVLPYFLIAQQVKERHRLVSPQLLQQKVAFKVSTDAARILDTSARVERVDGFRLKAGEEKAVAQTGIAISRVDRSVLPDRIDTSANAGLYMLPELFYAKESGTGNQFSYRILFIDAAPLKYDFSKKLFEGSIRFLPMEVREAGNDHAGQKQLSTPEDILVSFGAVSKSIRIHSINWPPLDLSIQAEDPRDSVEVKILTVSNPLGYPKKLGVEPAIILSSAREKIQGMGIQSLPIHLSLKGVSGNRMVPVSLESSLGSLDSSSLVLVGEKAGKVNLRSESLGQIEIRSINQNYRSNTLTIKAVFPWLFLLLALLGGLIGALGKNLIGKKKIRIRPLILGSIMGLIAAVAYWGLGIVLIGFSLETRGFNEAMVMGFGLLAGYFGLSVGKTSGA
ncbi:MAG: hypothetical protein IPH88_16850 [Bacteroidales bacterium]|nr:hypothetical protein [Bacteroidales bacterium]